MSLRDDLIPLVDQIRREIIDQEAGLRIHTVVKRIKRWSGSVVGEGTATNFDITIDPLPRVRDFEPPQNMSEAGRFEKGDRIIDRITLVEQDPTPDNPAGQLNINEELIYLIDGDQYTLVSVEDHYLERVAHVRRRINTT